ncbi:MAG: SRPBCC family protein [Rhodocyclales bacterium]|nr:SRPBCC family protein [Rhodocyclales bacterium]
MLKLMLVVVFVLLAGLMIYVATRPASFRIQRSIRIAAPREKLFAYLADLHNFDAWSPWAPLDPAMRKTHSGPAGGVGAGYEWQGNNKVGHGRMEIVEAVAPERVLIKLDFLKPFEAHNMAEYRLAECDGETEFTWAMHGPNNFLSKVMGLFFNMDRMVGAQFEQGLLALKTVAERGEA